MMKKKDNAPLDVSEQTRDISFIFSTNVDKFKEFLKKTNYSFYVILLGREDDHFIKNFMIKNWKNLHYMSGEKILFLSIYKPDKIDNEIKEDLKKKFGDLIDNTATFDPSPAWSYKYARLLGIPISYLPCIFIGTDINKNKGIFIKVPRLNEKYLKYFFEFLFNNLNELADLDEEEKLKKLKENIYKFLLEKFKLKSKEIFIEYILPNIDTQKIIAEIISMVIGGLIRGLK